MPDTDTNKKSLMEQFHEANYQMIIAKPGSDEEKTWRRKRDDLNDRVNRQLDEAAAHD